jgi:tetratricopeptide (TPR) repeat protein
MGVVCELKGDRGRAADCYDRFRRVTQWRTEDNPDEASYFIDLGIVLTRIGQRNRAGAAAQRAAEIDSTAHLEWARFRSVQGSADESLGQLQRAIDGGFRDLILLKYHPDFRRLRDDPRFTELLDRYLQT